MLPNPLDQKDMLDSENVYLLWFIFLPLEVNRTLVEKSKSGRIRLYCQSVSCVTK